LSSDDPRILAEGSAVDDVLLLQRPPELSTPTATSHSAILHSLVESERVLGCAFDAVALVQCTSPFTLPSDVDGTIAVMERTRSGSVFSVTELDHAYHPAKVRLLEGDRLVAAYEGGLEPRAAHETSTLWINNGSVYLSRREVVERGSLASDDLCGFAMPAERSLDINAPLDLEFARFLEARS